MSRRRLEIEWCGQRLTLLAEREGWWARERSLVVADVHVGKAAAFRTLGVPVPESVTAADLDRLSALVSEWRAERLIVLGDLLHAALPPEAPPLAALAKWRKLHEQLDVLVVRGNHDERAGEAGTRFRYVEPGFRVGPLTLTHAPELEAAWPPKASDSTTSRTGSAAPR